LTVTPLPLALRSIVAFHAIHRETFSSASGDRSWGDMCPT
jgi:hypothetical protein